MTDAQWEGPEAVLPPLPRMGRKPRDRRQCFDGIWWRARTGSPWRDVPKRYGPWETAYTLFRRWQIDGTWAKVLKKLQVEADSAGHIEWEVSVDSTACRAHQRVARASATSCRSCPRFLCVGAAARPRLSRGQSVIRIRGLAADVTQPFART
ncbi:transposase [Streptomyces exfoliatus]|uniref:transposase n=1 Tax=Streptomyces exfoliatus TaxID=1905 RepID=UPI00099D3110